MAPRPARTNTPTRPAGANDGPILLTHRPVELPQPDGVPCAYDGLVVEV